MLIGLDLDNTVISYDDLYWTLALERDLFASSAAPLDKVAIRDHLRSAGKEPLWTELQGLAYGSRLDEARPFPGVIETLTLLTARGHSFAIVSHKTERPYIGAPTNLHDAARAWLRAHGLVDNPLIAIGPADVYLELTREQKLRRIGQIQSASFVDDLPDILADPLFPNAVRPILFDPMGSHHAAELPTLHSWTELPELLARP